MFVKGIPQISLTPCPVRYCFAWFVQEQMLCEAIFVCNLPAQLFADTKKPLHFCKGILGLIYARLTNFLQLTIHDIHFP